MPRIIKNESIVEDDWQVLTPADGEAPEAVALPDGLVLLPLSIWLARRAELIAGQRPLGVWLDSDEGPEALAGDVDRFAVIGVNFPKFTDGRSYSSARLLRERYGYQGEIRALGDVLHDQLFYMRRCGIDAYAPVSYTHLDVYKRQSQSHPFSQVAGELRDTQRVGRRKVALGVDDGRNQARHIAKLREVDHHPPVV